MDALAVIGVIGGIALLVAVFGGGVKAKEIEIPPIPPLLRILSGVIGSSLIGIVIWLLVPPPQPPQPTETLVVSTATPTETSQSTVWSVERYAVVYPSCNCEETVTQFDAILMRLRWGAKTSSLAEQGAGFITYTVALDGQPILGIENYRVPAVFVAQPIFSNDPKDAWWVYWDYPIGSLDVGLHKITVERVNGVAIDNGWSITPAGTKESFEVTVNVVAEIERP